MLPVLLLGLLAVAPVDRVRAASPPRPSDALTAFKAIAAKEAAAAGLPGDIADAVMAIESSYDPSKIGGVGEIGLMQIRPSTAAMLGFAGGLDELAKPETNIHYGVVYLAGAWKLSRGDLCTALMKYRAGHGETAMTQHSVDYCIRARAHLAAAGSAFAGSAIPMPTLGSSPNATPSRPPRAGRRVFAFRGADGLTRVDTHLRGEAFWAAHDARVKVITARLERRWRIRAAP